MSASRPLLSPTAVGIQGDDAEGGGIAPVVQKRSHNRLKSLDAMRGMTVVMMILVDNVGGWFGDHLARQDPANHKNRTVWFGVGHSPWNEVSVADFVMPFFLFMVGCSMSLTFAKYRAKAQLAKKAMIRTVKIFVIGLLIQGGSVWGAGYNMSTIRVSGILQRIAFAYGVVSLMAIYLPKNTVVGWKRNGLWTEVSGKVWSKSFRYYALHWLVAASFLLIYLAVTFGVYVPDWVVPLTNRTVKCNTRGDLTPACSAARLVDRWFLTWDHMCHDLFAHRLPDCSSCYPENCPIPLNSPDRAPWCDARFEPEGILASIPTVVTVWIGMHYGLVLQHYKQTHSKFYICKFWFAESTVFVGLGWIIHAAGFKMNKQLWSPSYLFFMAGMAGYFLLFFFAFLDYTAWQPKLFTSKLKLGKKIKLGISDVATPLTWVGMNTMLVYLLSPSGSQFHQIVEKFYWNGNTDHTEPQLFYNALCTTDSCGDFKWTATQPPPSNLSSCKSWDQHIPGCINGKYPLSEICSICTGGAFAGHHERHAMLAWTVLRIWFWIGVAGVLHWRGFYWAV